MKLKIGLITLFFLLNIGGILYLNQKMISELKTEIETKSAEIAKLENVIENQNEEINDKKRAIEDKDRILITLEEEIDRATIEINKMSQIKLINDKQQVGRGSNPQKINVVATAYTSRCKGCIGITKGGTNVKNTIYHENGMKIIAVDPKVIPLGSIVEINGEKFIADDVGGAIKGKKIDILVKTYNEAIEWGRQNVEVTILRRG